jgi:hypothetical protein
LDRSLGKVDICLECLLELQHLLPNEGEYHLTVDRDATIDDWVNFDVVLFLVDKKRNPTPARLSVQVTQDSTSVVAGGAVKQAQSSAQKLVGPVVANMSDAVTNAANAISNKQNLITAFEAFMNKLEVLVKIRDEVTKVCLSLFPPLLHDRNWSF